MVAPYSPLTGPEYALAARVDAMPLALVAAAVSQVFVAEAARLTRTNPRGVRRLIGRTTIAFGLGGLACALAALVATPLLAVPEMGERVAAGRDLHRNPHPVDLVGVVGGGR